MKSLVLATGFAALLATAASAQTTTTTPAAPSATTTTPATGTMGTAPATGAMGTETGGASAAMGGANSAIVVMPQPQAGAAPSNYLASDVEDEDVYGANNEKIGEVEDFVMNADGTVAAVVLEVGGFLGVGEKDVLVNWKALQIAMDGDDMRITSTQLTREALEAAQDIDVDTMVRGRD